MPSMRHFVDLEESRRMSKTIKINDGQGNLVIQFLYRRLCGGAGTIDVVAVGTECPTQPTQQDIARWAKLINAKLASLDISTPNSTLPYSFLDTLPCTVTESQVERACEILKERAR